MQTEMHAEVSEASPWSRLQHEMQSKMSSAKAQEVWSLEEVQEEALERQDEATPHEATKALA